MRSTISVYVASFHHPELIDNATQDDICLHLNIIIMLVKIGIKVI